MAPHTLAIMEPMLPTDGNPVLENLAFDLIARANALAGMLAGPVRRSIGELVRSMNCYYSNLIEGHNTHPLDIDRALKQEFQEDPRRRELQIEAVAHIEAQRQIDEGRDPAIWPASREYLRWLHAEFCRKLPEELRWVEDPATHERLRVEPGHFRQRTVQVGRHIPPPADDLADLLLRFEQSYAPERLSKPRQVLSIAAAHHRLVWIHPFLDGNGRVTRLMSHAMLVRLGLSDGLWSVARGLARSVQTYRARLIEADQPRWNDLDGRGALSQTGLDQFCEYFLTTCIDQVTYMESLLDLRTLLRRIEQFGRDEVDAGRLRKGSFALLREALLLGEYSRGAAAGILGASDRTARNVLAALLQQGLLVSDSPKGPVRLGFPLHVAERWFPKLYPVE